ncbi:toll/interleukin-1 receptor domain-containing protein [Puteibacter caeruleilacunae]|nr:toll/interleukin-1 receptor domain-containing protein [Puteibacter caeruleilacunae]
MKKIFVSYTVRDNIVKKDFLEKVESFLQAYGRPFIDLLHNNSENKQLRVETELTESDCLILINTKDAKKSEWVNKELSIAIKNGIPVFEYDYKKLEEEEFHPITINIGHWANGEKRNE